MKKQRTVLNERGQYTIEFLLLLSVFVGLSLSVSNYAKNQGWMANLVEGPWKPMQGMIEDGVWQPAPKSKANHPSLFVRRASVQGDPP